MKIVTVIGCNHNNRRKTDTFLIPFHCRTDNSATTSTKSRKSKSPSRSRVDESSRLENAKAFSSEQYFERDRTTTDSERYKLDKFQGSAAISSDEYFDRPQQIPTGYSAVINNANLADVKDYVKDGVKNVAERFSSYATSVIRRLNTDDY